MTLYSLSISLKPSGTEPTNSFVRGQEQEATAGSLRENLTIEVDKNVR